MKYRIINLDNLEKLTIEKKDNQYYNDNKKIVISDDDFMLEDYLIPKKVLSKNMIITINKKNYWLTNLIKYNKRIDCAFNISNNDAFNLYCYYKDKNSAVELAEKIIDDYQIRIFKKFCYIALLYIDKYNDKQYTSEYILNQILLCITNNNYDCNCLDIDGKLFNKIDTLSNKFDEKYGFDLIPIMILKNTCNNMKLINKYTHINIELKELIKIFIKDFANNYKKNNKIKIIKKRIK